MAKKRYVKGGLCLLAAALLLGALLRLSGGRGEELPVPSASPTPFPAPAGLRIAVASDLHLDPDNTDRSGEASETVYSPELVEALLWDARQQGAELLLLTGDLVNGGKPQRHAALTELLRRAEAEGLTVCVLPGNHDLAPVRQTDFAETYSAFGYGEAWSRDAASLSYCVLRDDLLLLLMDTGGYSPGAIDLPGAAPRSSDTAFLSEETLQWAEAMLQEAQRRGLPVLCAGHGNLLPELSRQPGSVYYLENGERFAALLRAYSVPLYLSGHLHVRAVYQEEGLTELLTEYLLSYPTGYSVLDLNGSTLRVTPRRVDVDAWAAQTGQEDPKLLHFSAWQLELLRGYSRSNVEYMAQRNPLSEREKERAADFFYAAMQAFWSGEMQQRRAALEAMPGYRPFFRCAEGYSYGWWLKDAIENASPLMRGFELAW